MASTSMLIPVFMPGNDRKYVEIKGAATITEEGEVRIQLQSPAHARQLVEWNKEHRLLCVGFDLLDEAPRHE